MAKTEKKEGKGNAFTSNPIIKAVGTQKLIAFLALVILYIVFGLINRSFWSTSTLINIFEASYYIGLMAIGVTFAITSDGIDLSIGTVMMCSALMSGALITKYNVPVVVALIVCILIGAIFGTMNGLMVSYMKLPPFIATLGTMMLSKGIGSVFTRAQSVTWPQASDPNGWFRKIFKVNVGNTVIPTGFILLMVIAVLAAILLNKTRPGRYIVSLGSNYEATRLSGVNVAKYRTLAYIISGTLAGLAGLAYAAIYSTVLPGGGGGMELDAIAGVVIGGTSMSGGFGTISGTLLGVFIMSVLKTGLPFIGLQTHYQQIATGIVLVFAVFVDVWNRNKKKKV